MKKLLFILLLATSYQAYSQQRDPAVLLNLVNNGDAQAQEELGDYYYKSQAINNASATYKIGNYYNVGKENYVVKWFCESPNLGSGNIS